MRRAVAGKHSLLNSRDEGRGDYVELIPGSVTLEKPACDTDADGDVMRPRLAGLTFSDPSGPPVPNAAGAGVG